MQHQRLNIAGYIYSMKFVLMVLFLSFALNSFCQPVQKILVIDTLLSQNSHLHVAIATAVDARTLNNYAAFDSLSSKNSVIGGYVIKVLPEEAIIRNGNRFFVSLILEDSSSIINLPLDDSGGALKLLRAYSIAGDTIVINKHTVFHNCCADTIKSSLSWFRHYNRDNTKNLKLLKNTSYPNKAIEKNCEETYPETILYTVNGKKYIVTPCKVAKRVGVKWQHGTKKMSRRQEKRYDGRKRKGKPYTYFSATTETIKYHLLAELRLR